MSPYTFTVHNQSGQPLVIYSTKSVKQPSNPPSLDATDYRTVYTEIGTVDVGQSTPIETGDLLNRIVAARQSDEFPQKLAVLNFLDSGDQEFTVTADDGTYAQRAWEFYKNYAGQPDDPTSLKFYNLVTQSMNPLTLLDQVKEFFNANNYPGVDWGMFSMVSYWATNSLYAINGTYWCYGPKSSTGGFVIPPDPVGTIDVGQGKATFQADGGPPVRLTYSNSLLTSDGATEQTGIYLQGTLIDVSLENTSFGIVMCFSGHRDGTRLCAQPFEHPQLPWYAIAYDLTYGAFQTIQYAMALDMALHMLKSIAGGVRYLVQNIGKFADSVSQWLNKLGDSVAPETSSIGEDVDPINVDVDVDVDIDVDVDVDIDIDIDVDVDVDIDIDVDVDFGVVVDVDVDVDIDVDIDVVTDTDTDIDIDVDVDVDTDVNVETGTLGALVGRLGGWIIKEALPFLLKNAAIYIAFQGADALLKVWKDASEESLQPRQSTGLGMLVNYMLNENNSLQERWDTFAGLATQPQMDSTTLQTAVVSVIMTPNTAADTAAQKWRWPESEENNVVSGMHPPYSTGTATDAFHYLGSYTYNGQQLPVKVGAQVAVKYLKSSGVSEVSAHAAA